jgi:hypothetical protein
MRFLIAHGFDVQDQSGMALPAEDLHARGVAVMDALLALEKCNDDIADATTYSEAENGIVVVEMLVTAANEADALRKFMDVTRTAIHTAGGSTRFWSEPGIGPTSPNADYRPDKLELEYPSAA